MKRHPDAVERAEARVRRSMAQITRSERAESARALSALRRAYRDAAIAECVYGSTIFTTRWRIYAAFARRRAK